jgi:hypothetical protein
LKQLTPGIGDRLPLDTMFQSLKGIWAVNLVKDSPKRFFNMFQSLKGIGIVKAVG